MSAHTASGPGRAQGADGLTPARLPGQAPRPACPASLWHDRPPAFEAETLQLFQDHARGGVLNEDAVFTALIAHCSSGDA
ncbi:hypothetical protein ACICHK_39400 [Streptomyces sp. AHU1]|uniref:hypothetical protein n=1 Tax=Streptomyces sp. AHU1 TaxID=3377215 RepID=UPI003877D644